MLYQQLQYIEKNKDQTSTLLVNYHKGYWCVYLTKNKDQNSMTLDKMLMFDDFKEEAISYAEKLSKESKLEVEVSHQCPSY
jgi:hypothetical protein